MARQAAEISISGERVTLLPERALYWPAQKSVVVADLHWGKSETFHQFGIPIPSALFDDDLNRLAAVIEQTGAEQVIVLGDLIHGKKGLTAEVVERLTRWRKDNPVKFLVAEGNHDRALKSVAKVWNLQLRDEFAVGPFTFRHEPKPTDTSFTWCGHLQPTYVIVSGGEALRLPCFHLSKNRGIVPSFSSFTRGLKLAKRPGDRVFVVAPNSVQEV